MPAIAPQAPTIASQGLTRTSGSGSIGRAPSLSSRMKQSCRLVNSRLARLAQVEIGEQPPDARSTGSRTSGCSILLNQPMNRVASRRGMRLVSRKLMSSCWNTLVERGSHCHQTVRPAGNTIRRHGFALHDLRALRARRRRARDVAGQAEGAARAVEGQASVAARPRAHGAPLAALVPFYEYDEAAVLPLRRRAGRGRARAAAPASCGWRRCIRDALRRDARG